MDYKKYNDYELIYMVQENDEESNGILFKKYYPIIFNISNNYYKRYSEFGYDLEDFYQEALSSFYGAIRNYDNNKGVLFYSFVILCINRSLQSFCRKLSNSKRDYLNINNFDIDELEYRIEDIRSNIDDISSYRELEDIIKDVIYTVSMESSSILELKINGFTYKEISILLDIPISSVEFKSRKARNLLRRRVKAYYCK